ncbi:hypothetical protein L1987_46010 [Smallanthus sonchifolius]|uniref:Uncharacterized protein n=1 Tax=Smallanthus sonchifolius TaxID=185202 RepID=A0ACB9FYC1_9ASTR|nr:hypothetical protein L1987_46010 [Smallanthus sonchifolius]
MFDLRADWFRSAVLRLRASEPPPSRNPYQAPHLHNQLPPPMRDPYLTPDPYHPDPRARQTMAPTSAMGVPFDAIHQYVRTSEFVRQGIEHEIRHDLPGQRIDSLGYQVWCKEEKIANLEEVKEILIARTEATRAEAQFAIRVTIAMFVLVLICFLIESYLRR